MDEETVERAWSGRWWVLALAIGLIVVSVGWWWLHPARRDRPGEATAASGVVIDVNQADAATLQLLPGLGPALAQRVVAEREAHGAYRDLEDLQRVSGIGARVAAGLAGLVVFGEEESEE